MPWDIHSMRNRVGSAAGHAMQPTEFESAIRTQAQLHVPRPAKRIWPNPELKCTRKSSCKRLVLVCRTPTCICRSVENAFRAVSASLVPLAPPDALIELSKPPTKPKCIMKGCSTHLAFALTNLELNAVPAPKVVLQML